MPKNQKLLKIDRVQYHLNQAAAVEEKAARAALSDDSLQGQIAFREPIQAADGALIEVSDRGDRVGQREPKSEASSPLWLRIDRIESEADANLSLDQAREIHAKLGSAIAAVSDDT